MFQYELLVRDNRHGHRGQEITQTFYGQLKYIIELQLPGSDELSISRKR
jgi:hypothetical protein